MTPVAVPPTSMVVVVPVLNEAATIERVVTELLCGLPRDGAVVVADGGSSDGTQRLVAQMAARDPRIALLHNAARVQSAAINLVARAHRGSAQWLIRADAHATYPAGFAARVVATLQRTGADAVVVPMDSHGGTAVARAIAWVSDTPIGSGGSAHRGGHAAGWIDHGHHAGWKLSSFLATGGYDESFSHNEDAEFDCRLRARGGRIWIDPAIRLIYHVRPCLRALWQQYRNYGRGRSRTVVRHPSSLRLRQGVVPAGVLAVTGGALIAPVAPIAALVPATYGVILLLASLHLVWRHRSASALLCGVAAMVMHFAWATGFLGGLTIGLGMPGVLRRRTA